MKLNATKVKKVVGLVAGSFMFISFGAAAGGPIGASLQTNANEHDADDTNANSVVISVVLTQNNGLPTPRLGDSGQDLPKGWYFRSDFNGQPLATGCALDIANFENVGWGIYTFELAPASSPNNPNVTCTWAAGEYHYALSIYKVGQGGGGLYRGTALGSFVIPDNPANNTP